MAHVLLVDDHPELLVTVAETLRARGFTVTEAGSRAAANQAIATAASLDIVVTDSILSGGNGDDVVRAARGAGLPVIVISGDPRRIAHYVSGQIAFLAKPFHPAQLAELIESVLAAANRAR